MTSWTIPSPTSQGSSGRSDDALSSSAGSTSTSSASSGDYFSNAGFYQKRAPQSAEDYRRDKIICEGDFLQELELTKKDTDEFSFANLSLFPSATLPSGSSYFTRSGFFYKRSPHTAREYDQDRIIKEGNFLEELERTKKDSDELSFANLSLFPASTLPPGSSYFTRDGFFYKRSPHTAREYDQERIIKEGNFLDELERTKKDTDELSFANLSLFPAATLSLGPSYFTPKGFFQKRGPYTAEEYEQERLISEGNFLQELEATKDETD